AARGRVLERFLCARPMNRVAVGYKVLRITRCLDICWDTLPCFRLESAPFEVVEIKPELPNAEGDGAVRGDRLNWRWILKIRRSRALHFLHQIANSGFIRRRHSAKCDG